MFYGHRGSRNPFRSNNDRTIAFYSLLDPRAQSEAKMNYAFTLKGTGIHRNLRLLEGEDVNILDCIIPRADFYYKGNFFFFGLPAGDFELAIRAQGYKPFIKKCFVKAGKQIDPMLVELTPEQ
jgi:hypothetical protein